MRYYCSDNKKSVDGLVCGPGEEANSFVVDLSEQLFLLKRDMGLILDSSPSGSVSRIIKRRYANFLE